MSKHYDAIVIGTGQAGPPLAKRLSNAGMSVAVVERHLFGGTCVNTGCIPTKAMVASAYAAHLARRGRDYGVAIAYSSALIALMLVAIWLIQLVVGERRLGRRAVPGAPAKAPGAAQLGTTAA